MHALKVYGGAEVHIHSYINVLDEVFSFTLPPRKVPLEPSELEAGLAQPIIEKHTIP